MSGRVGKVELVQIACVWEATARKIGNVHRFMDFQKTSYLDFLLSAAAIAPCLNNSSAQVGQMILNSVNATREVVGQNTNLGIILLLAPICAVNEAVPLQQGLEKVLATLNQSDAKLAFEAIRLAKPGGLGTAGDQDVKNEPTATLLEAMRLATDRDMIARQYANGFAEVIEFCVPTFLEGMKQFGSVEMAIVHLQVELMAKYPDSLIARKNGLGVAEDVRQISEQIKKLGGISTREGRAAGVHLDQYLRRKGNRLNPGTTADLIAACLFVALRENKVMPSAPFQWQVEDWL